jgi:undecaprenyl diphosphate synthase
MNIKHVAIIMDGNGRWAEKRGLSRIEGHREGVRRVGEIIDASIELKLKALTLYTFSMENWKRPKREVNALMSILRNYLMSEMEKLSRDNVVFRAIGNLERLPKNVQELLREFENMTKKNSGLLLTSALSYGGKEEIVGAVKRILNDGLAPEDINERTLENYLYTSGLPDPDLIIRTSGEIRLSNFLLWQSAYSEFYFTETLWPDFGRNEFISALRSYKRRKRRFGALP